MTSIPVCAVAGGCGLNPHDVLAMTSIVAAGGVGTWKMWLLPKSKETKLKKEK